jgi:hypothetical protein
LPLNKSSLPGPTQPQHVKETAQHCKYCNALVSKKKLTGHMIRRCPWNPWKPFATPLRSSVRVTPHVVPGQGIASSATARCENFRCCVCEKTFKGRPALLDHMLSHAKKEQVYQCLVCSTDFSSKMSLNGHMDSHSGTAVIHKCVVCSEGFPRVKNLRKHLKNHL